MKNSKKTAVIAIVLVMAVALMGFGFAAWTTTLNATGKIQTNANWDVEFIACDAVTKHNANWLGTKNAITTVNTPNDTLDLGTIEISQPGGFVVLEVKVKNCGTINADLTNVDFAGTNSVNGFDIYVSDEFTPSEAILTPGQVCTFNVVVKADDQIDDADFDALNINTSHTQGGAAKDLKLTLTYVNDTTMSSATVAHGHA